MDVAAGGRHAGCGGSGQLTAEDNSSSSEAVPRTDVLTCCAACVLCAVLHKATCCPMVCWTLMMRTRR